MEGRVEDGGGWKIRGFETVGSETCWSPTSTDNPSTPPLPLLNPPQTFFRAQNPPHLLLLPRLPQFTASVSTTTQGLLRPRAPSRPPPPGDSVPGPFPLGPLCPPNKLQYPRAAEATEAGGGVVGICRWGVLSQGPQPESWCGAELWSRSGVGWGHSRPPSLPGMGAARPGRF